MEWGLEQVIQHHEEAAVLQVKKDFTYFDFDPTVLFVCLAFKRSVIVLSTIIKLLVCYLIYILFSRSN